MRLALDSLERDKETLADNKATVPFHRGLQYRNRSRFGMPPRRAIPVHKKKVDTRMRFSQLGLSEPLVRATDALGYETATPIQAQAIPVILAGGDLIGIAQTGTGKTAAFTLPMLDRLNALRPAPKKKQKADGERRNGYHGANRRARTLRALVLAPTRELAAQIEGSLNRYGRHTPLRQTVVFGGVSQTHQVKSLRHGVDVLVATPGRLLDLMGQGYIDLSEIEILVFDEADQMLDMGFLPALKRIVSAVPTQRQTLMFSATMPVEIRRLAQQWLTKPASIQVTPVATSSGQITQSVHLVDKRRKPDLLSYFLHEIPQSRTLVFSRTKHGADKIVKRLNRDGLNAVAIHGNKSQNARNRALARFKSKSPPVLVATDIAARGLDINNISHVVNFDLPETPETYIHRIGRTARAGAEGVAVSFCSGDERGLLRQIERLTKVAIEVEATIDGFEPTEPVRNGHHNTNGKPRAKRKPRRFGSKTEAGASSVERRPRRRKRRPGKVSATGRARSPHTTTV